MMIAIAAALALVAGVAAAPADVSGKWEGKLTMERDGEQREDSALLILTQKGQTITGTVGGNDSDQHPITSGTIDGDKIVLVAKNANNDREYRIELTVAGDELKGTIASGDRRGQVYAKKRKE
jgi:hypothetical protein